MYRIEIVPRYGTSIGIIWKKSLDEISNIEKDETIGHIRLSDDKDTQLWQKVIELINQEIKK